MWTTVALETPTEQDSVAFSEMRMVLGLWAVILLDWLLGQPSSRTCGINLFGWRLLGRLGGGRSFVIQFHLTKNTNFH